jgi:hypothetical protein
MIVLQLGLGSELELGLLLLSLEALLSLGGFALSLSLFSLVLDGPASSFFISLFSEEDVSSFSSPLSTLRFLVGASETS